MTVARLALRSANINVMMAAVQKAARGLVRDFGELEHLQVSRKGLGDFVSTADKRSEKILIQELSKARPGYSFITEESGEITGVNKDYCWVIDPLDGTSNFLHGIPHFAIVVALKKGDEIIASVTYDPIKNEMFCAEKGNGSFLNQRRIRVSARRNLEESLVVVGVPKMNNEKSMQIFQKRMESMRSKVGSIRYFGSGALELAYVAAGRLEACVLEGQCIWDIAAGILQVKEAGGQVTEISGGKDMLKSGDILATNEWLYNDIQKLCS